MTSPYNKWVFKKNMNTTGRVEKFKYLVVVKVYSQVEGVEFRENFSPLEKLTSIRVLMYLASKFDMEIE
jgi:hypothetical protein